MGIPFDLNNTAIKIAEVSNSRRNLHFMKESSITDKVLMAGRLYHLLTNVFAHTKYLRNIKRNV